ncbi:MAG: porin family protein [Prevotella sp.]|nr:porin family protein [Prevotella sp.]
MKKFFLAAVMMVATLSANAQNEVGQITLAPTVGANFAKNTGDGNKFAFGWEIGVNAEYGVAESFGITLGAFYKNWGTKPDNDGAKKANLNYLSIPVLANYYVVKGLAIKAGVQPAFLLSAKNDGYDFKDACKKFDLTIPVGLSYEISNVVIDARYNFGLTKVGKVGDAKNSVIELTVGYKFAL